MPAQQEKSATTAEHRSVRADVAGVPWWGAVLIAVGATAIGFAFEAGTGGRELGIVFGALYIIGCVAAVLAVRQESIFTAVVQPPVILFLAVPGAYYLFEHAKIKGAKDFIINCVYPLIESFLLMFTTSVVVLLIGMARWYFGSERRRHTEPSTALPGAGLFAALKAKVTGTDPEPTPRKHTTSRAAAGARRQPPRGAPARSRRPQSDGGDEISRPRPQRRPAPRDPDSDIRPPRREPGRRPPPPRQGERTGARGHESDRAHERRTPPPGYRERHDPRDDRPRREGDPRQQPGRRPAPSREHERREAARHSDPEFRREARRPSEQGRPSEPRRRPNRYLDDPFASYEPSQQSRPQRRRPEHESPAHPAPRVRYRDSEPSSHEPEDEHRRRRHYSD